jgi:hypothetical protein
MNALHSCSTSPRQWPQAAIREWKSTLALPKTWGLLLFPQWQVGYFALGHALHVSGRRQESAEVIEAGLLLRPRFAEDYDGWAVYDHGRAERFEPLWQQMREDAIS